MGPVRMLFPLAALVACQPAPRSAAPDELTRLSEDLALYDVSFARSHQVVELVERWAGDAPVLVHVDIEDATVIRGGDAPGVWTDVTLRVHEVLRDDLEELAQDDLILLTVPGGDDGEERVVSTDAPLFYPGDSALVTLDLIDDELALSQGHWSLLATHDDALVACVNPSGLALMGCIEAGVPSFPLERDLEGPGARYLNVSELTTLIR